MNKKRAAAVAVVALGVLPFYACSNSEQAAYMERPSIEANALEAEQAEQEFAELAAQESAGEDTHASTKGHGDTHGKKEKTEAKAVAKHETPKADKRKPAHETSHEPVKAEKVAKAEIKSEKKSEKKLEKKSEHHGDDHAVAAHKPEPKSAHKPESKAVAHAAPAKVETHAKTETHATTRKVASVPQTGSASSVWVVQLGAFRIKENAEKLTATLKTNGYPVLMRPMNHSKNGQLFVVSLEPTPNKAEAQKWQQELKTKSFDTNLVLRKD